MLTVRLLGGLALEVDGRMVPAPGGRCGSLLAWLALHPGKQPRSRVAARLWPEVLDESARRSLRTALLDLRRALGPDAGRHLHATRDEVGLWPLEEVRVDVREFELAVAEERLEQALELAAGELLPEFEHDWLYEARDAHQREVARVIEKLATDAESRGDLQAAVEHTRRLVAMDDLAEEHARALIRRLVAADDRAAALAAYERHRERLRTELRVAPSAATRTLVEKIRADVDGVDASKRDAAEALALHNPLKPHTSKPLVGATLHVRLLGGFAVSYGDGPVTTLDTPRLQSLLAYLLVNRNTPQPRARLAFLFWPDSEEAQARTNLRQLLHSLRRALPDADRFVEMKGKSVSWRADAPYVLDTAEFEALLEHADSRPALEQALALYGGDLLPSCYEDWILPERERLRGLFLNAAEQLCERLESERDWRGALRWAKPLFDADPGNETSCSRLMRLHALSGDRAGALRAYHRCATVLWREAGIEPSAPTREAYEQLAGADRVGDTVHSVSPLVGRRDEWDRLRGAWQRAAAGRAQFVLVGGEPGIGKSRLAEELRTWAQRQRVVTATARSYEAEGRLAYGPAAEWLRSEALRPTVAQLADPWLTELARLLPEILVERPELPHPEPLTAEWQRGRLLEALARAVLAGGGPLLLVVDDLQWCDRGTLEWLHYLVRTNAEAPLLVVGTARMQEVGVEHPLRLLLAGSRAEVIELEPLGPGDTTDLARRLSGRELETPVRETLYRETEGNPLFVVEAVQAGLEVLTPRVQAVIETRIAQLTQAAQELAGLAATVGRAFTVEVLVNASSHDDDAVVGALDELWQARIVRERGGGAYDFSHDKLREVAYARTSPARRQILHGRVAQALERRYASDLDGVSAQLAAHYERAGWPERAMSFYSRGAEVAQRVYANEEAITLLTKALGLLEGEPPGQSRDERELALRTALGAPLVVVRGYGALEVRDTYLRAADLCERLGRPESPPVLRALGLAFLTRGEFGRAQELGERLLALGERTGDPMVRVEGHYLLGVNSFWRGEFADSREQLERAVAGYVPECARAHLARYSQDPRIVCMSRLAYTLWYLGHPEEAEETARSAIRLAKELGDPQSLGYALNFGAWLSIDRGDEDRAQERAGQMAELADKHHLGFLQPMGGILRGWVMTREGRTDEAIATIRVGLGDYERSGQILYRPYVLALLARACADAGRFDSARSAVSEALEVSERTGQRFLDADLFRLSGELRSGAEAEACFERALQIARDQGAKSLEWRVRASLDRTPHRTV